MRAHASLATLTIATISPPARSTRTTRRPPAPRAARPTAPIRRVKFASDHSQSVSGTLLAGSAVRVRYDCRGSPTAARSRTTPTCGRDGYALFRTTAPRPCSRCRTWSAAHAARWIRDVELPAGASSRGDVVRDSRTSGAASRTTRTTATTTRSRSTPRPRRDARVRIGLELLGNPPRVHAGDKDQSSTTRRSACSSARPRPTRCRVGHHALHCKSTAAPCTTSPPLRPKRNVPSRHPIRSAPVPRGHDSRCGSRRRACTAGHGVRFRLQRELITVAID